MKDLSQFLFIKDVLQCDVTDNSVHSKGLKFAIVFCWLANNLSYYVFSKNEQHLPLVVHPYSQYT